MPNNFPENLELPLAGRKIRCMLALCGLLGIGGTAIAASIEGVVTGVTGEPLERVPVCLALSSSEDSCEKLRWTDRKGGYSFNGVKAGSDYLVRIFADRSPDGRRAETYTTYVWSPAEQPVVIDSRSEQLRLEAFVGKFNFSNFQRILTLTATDFPELETLDLQGSYVALKVFIPSSRPQEPPETIYLGQVTSLENLRIEASLPLAMDAIYYEIYSATLSLSGAIALSGV